MSEGIELGGDSELVAGFEAAHVASAEPEVAFDDANYQEIADRRAQTEDAEVLRRARSL